MGYFRPEGRPVEPGSDWIWLEPNYDDPSRDPIDLDLAAGFPEQTCRDVGFIPVSFADGVLSIAVSQDASAARARQVAMDLARAAVFVYCCEQGELDRALERVFGGAQHFEEFPLSALQGEYDYR